MRRNYLYFVSVLALGLCGSAQAQPDTNNAPKGDNPPNWNWNPGARAGNRMRGDIRRYMPATPEQLRLVKARQAEAAAFSIRTKLVEVGFNDEALLTAVVNEYKAQDAARTDLLDKWQKIVQATRPNQAPEADVTTLLKDFRERVANEKARRATAATALEVQFQISKKPVLDALLMTLGITGDEAELVGKFTDDGLTRALVIPNPPRLVTGLPTTNPRLFDQPRTKGGLFGNGK